MLRSVIFSLPFVGILSYQTARAQRKSANLKSLGVHDQVFKISNWPVSRFEPSIFDQRVPTVSTEPELNPV